MKRIDPLEHFEHAQQQHEHDRAAQHQLRAKQRQAGVQRIAVQVVNELREVHHLFSFLSFPGSAWERAISDALPPELWADTAGSRDSRGGASLEVRSQAEPGNEDN